MQSDDNDRDEAPVLHRRNQVGRRGSAASRRLAVVYTR